MVFFVYWFVTGLVYVLAWAISQWTGCDVLPVASVLEHGKVRATASHPHPNPNPHPHPNPNTCRRR